MADVRAKVYVKEVSRQYRGTYPEVLPEAERNPDGPASQYGPPGPHFGEKITFAFVAGNDKDSENAKFFAATPPMGPWDMMIDNPGAHGIFKPGQEYYLDFSLAPGSPVQ